MYTASVLVQIYDKVNPENKEKIVQRVGTIEKFTKLMPTLFDMISKNESVSESVKENAKQRLDELAPLAALAAGAVRLGAAALRTGGMAAARGLASAAALGSDSSSSSSSSNPAELGKKLAQATDEGSSPHPKGSKKYKAHMAAKHAGESVNEAWQAFKEGAPKIRYALVGTDMKIYAIGSDERDLRLDRRSLDKRFPDAAPLKMARLKTAQSIGDTVGSDQIKERSLTKGEETKREKYVKGMKKVKGDFKDRYGDDAKAVMYATATKMAKKNA
jgi:hypothetical protein